MNKALARMYRRVPSAFSGIRSWFDVNFFCSRVIYGRSISWFLITIFLFLAGLAGVAITLGNPHSPAGWVGIVFLVLAIIRLWRQIIENLRWLFPRPKAKLESDPKIVSVIQSLKLPIEYVQSGYKIDAPLRGGSRIINDSIVRSDSVDARLRQGTYKIRANDSRRRLVEALIRQDRDVSEMALRSFRYYNPRTKFINEKKISLGNDLLVSTEISIFKSSYFHSFLTNELCFRRLRSMGETAHTILSGVERYPASKRDGRRELQSIENSSMNNHIGISTIAFTADRKMWVWVQSGMAAVSIGELVSTGSGSSDWKDWTRYGGSSLVDLIARSMERELIEESKLEDYQEGLVMQTLVLGHFRWLRRGGKPEFVGITRTNLPSSNPRPNLEEVQGHQDHHLYAANNAEALKDTVETLLASPEVSVSLWVNLLCIKRALDTNDPTFHEFLWPSKSDSNVS